MPSSDAWAISTPGSEENVGGIRVVQAFANEDHERELFARDNAGYRSTKLEAYRVMRRRLR